MYNYQFTPPPSARTRPVFYGVAQGSSSSRCHVPSSAAPDKCKLEMPIEEFRTWKTSISWWLRLNNWSQTEAVGFIRLTCANELQRALDDRYTVQQWSVMTMEEALEAIAQIVVQPSNQAAEKGLFYNLKQGTYESISTFFTRVHKVSANCDFK